MRRFHITPEQLRQETFNLPADLLQHLRVLRLREGDRIELFDGCGGSAVALLDEIHKTGGRARIESRRRVPPQPLSLRLIQGIPKGSKMELLLQKGTELGISRFSPAYCANGDVMPAARQRSGRSERWQKVVREAARQSGRYHLPQIDAAAPLEEILAQAEDDLLLVPWEHGTLPLQEQLQGRQPRSITVLIGPEGGLSPEEVALAGERGFQAVTLGPRILRSETAGIAVASILQYLFGDLGSDHRVAGGP